MNAPRWIVTTRLAADAPMHRVELQHGDGTTEQLSFATLLEMRDLYNDTLPDDIAIYCAPSENPRTIIAELSGETLPALH